MKAYKIFVLSLISLSSLGLCSNNSWASPQSELRDALKAVREAQTLVNEDKLRIKDIQAELDGVDTSTSPEYSGNCSVCKPGGMYCSVDLFKDTMSFSDQDIRNATLGGGSCKLIYDTFQGNIASVPAYCAMAVRRCGDVARDLAKKKLAKDLDAAKKQLRSDNSDLRDRQGELDQIKSNYGIISMLQPSQGADVQAASLTDKSLKVRNYFIDTVYEEPVHPAGSLSGI